MRVKIPSRVDITCDKCKKKIEPNHDQATMTMELPNIHNVTGKQYDICIKCFYEIEAMLSHNIPLPEAEG